MKVLLVEDDASIAQSVIASLSNAGMTVEHVATAQGAIDAVAAATPDVVLMDLGLPDMDGLDASKIIRETSAVPIIIVSARGDELDRVLGLELLVLCVKCVRLNASHIGRVLMREKPVGEIMVSLQSLCYVHSFRVTA